MANFPGAAQAGFQTAQAIGPRPNAFGGFVKLMLADWQQKQQSQREILTKGLGDIFGESLKRQYGLSEWKPSSKEEKFELVEKEARAKRGVGEKQPIVNKKGEVVGYRPYGSVFQPTLNWQEELSGENNEEEQAIQILKDKGYSEEEAKKLLGL